MTQPAPEALEGNLRDVTDQQWRSGHEALVELVGDQWPAEELAFLWDPDLPGAALVGEHEVDEAPGGGDA